MRNPDRIDEFCNELAKLWHLDPDYRFTQIIESLFNAYKLTEGVDDMFYVEDDKLASFIKELNS